MKRTNESGAECKTSEQFISALMKGNKRAREDFKEFRKNALYYLLFAHDEEAPKSTILFQCADGRIGGPEMFARDPLIRFHDSWKPMAGIKMSLLLDQINDARDPWEALHELLSRQSRKKDRKLLFHEFELIFGSELRHRLIISQAAVLAGKKILLGEDYPKGILREVKKTAEDLIRLSGPSITKNKKIPDMDLLREKIKKLPHEGYPVALELQSHSIDPIDDHHHGCGAHNSDTRKALQLTAINALAMKAFLEDRYTKIAPRTRIIRTHHFTGGDERVVDAECGKLLSAIYPKLAKAAKGLFNPLHYKDKSHGIVRKGKGNPAGINVEHHDEYIIRFSQHHKAFFLAGTSVLEQVMPDDMELGEALAIKLISIALNNRVARDEKDGRIQPVFFHLDAPAEHDEMHQLYEEIYRRVMEKEMIQELMKKKRLFIIHSESRRLDYFDPKSLEVKFQN